MPNVADRSPVRGGQRFAELGFAFISQLTHMESKTEKQPRKTKGAKRPRDNEVAAPEETPAEKRARVELSTHLPDAATYKHVPPGFIDARCKVVVRGIAMQSDECQVFLVPFRRFIKDVAPIAEATNPEYKDAVSWMSQATWFTSNFHDDEATQAEGQRVEDLFQQWRNGGLKCEHVNKFYRPLMVIEREIFH